MKVSLKALVRFGAVCVLRVSLLLRMVLALTPPSRVVAGTLCCAVAATAMAAGAHAGEQKRSYRFPRGDAATILARFATESDRPILFMMDAVRGEQTNALAGTFAPREALDRLLAGTALVAAHDPKSGGFIVIRRAASAERDQVEAKKARGPPVAESPTPPKTTQAPPKKFPPVQKFPLFSLFATWLSVGSAASVSPTTTPNEDSAVVLSPFEVRAAVTPYQANVALGPGRIRTEILDIPQSISVFTREFMEDLGSLRLMDTVRFAAGTSEGTFGDGALDRAIMRGFQHDSKNLLDGYRRDLAVNLQPVLIERVEVIKGPNAIVAPNGSPGGAINAVSKSPLFVRRGSVKVNVGEYATNSVEVDVTGPLRSGSSRLAYRLIGLWRDSEDYAPNSTTDIELISPMFTWLASDKLSVKIKPLYYHGHQSASSNVPIDPRVGTDDAFAIYPNLSDRWANQTSLGNDQTVKSAQFELLASPQERLSIRASAYFERGEVLQRGGQIIGLPSGSGTWNPRTGKYDPFNVWTVVDFGKPTQAVTSAPVSMPDFNNLTTQPNGAPFALQVFDSVSKTKNFDWNVDFSYQLELGRWGRSSTVAGVASTGLRFSTPFQQANKTVNLPGLINSPEALDKAAEAGFAKLDGINLTDATQSTATRQIFATESIHLLSERLILSGNFTNYHWDQKYIGRYMTGGVDRTPPTAAGGSDNIFGYGVVYKPVAGVSLFYGYNESANAPRPGGFKSGEAAPGKFRYGDQSEIGIKTSLRKGTINASLSFFDVREFNYSIYDLQTDSIIVAGEVRSKGWEVEANAVLSPSWSVLAAYSNYEFRNQYGQRGRGAPDTTGSLFLRYTFRGGPLDRLWVAGDATYLERRAADNPPGGAVRGNPRPIAFNGTPYEPSYYLPSARFFNLTAGYTWNENVSLWLKLGNLTNNRDPKSSLGRFLTFPTRPRNVSASLTYKF